MNGNETDSDGRGVRRIRGIFRRRELWVLAGILLLAVVLRVLHLEEMKDV